MSLSNRMIAVLTSVGLLSGGLLTGVGLWTKARIAFNKQKEIQEAIAKVVPGVTSSQKLYEEKDLTVFVGRDEQGALIGLAVYTSGAGFQDKITLMYGIDPALSRIKSLTILEQLETPGLGAKITDEEAFLRYWENKKTAEPLTLRKPAAASPQELAPAEVNTITGATVSSQAVLDMVNRSLERLKSLHKEGKLQTEGEDAR